MFDMQATQMSTHPAVDENGVLDVGKLWKPTAKNKIIRASSARNRLRVGGTGSSKSSDAMMEGVTEYLLRFPGCFGLLLRTTMPELERTNIPNFKAYVPKDLYDWNDTKHIATFFNGSKLFFSHIQYFRWVDLEAYQSSSFPWIFFDECGGIPMNVWQFFQARNRVNPECKPDQLGKWPIPSMNGATNPIGAFWGAYKDYFVDKKPDSLPEGTLKDKHGRFWSPVTKNAKTSNAEDWRLEYDPYEWDFVHSTIFDNPHLLAKDPGIVDRLNSIQPKELRQKMLEGYMDMTVGQYFDCFDPYYDTVNLRDEPDSIIWQYWQPRWLGWDWGRAHWNAVFWFTKALVRKGGGEYKLKTVCYREYVDRGRDYIEMADIVQKMTRIGLPGVEDRDKLKTADYRAAYFSHEKFAKQMEAESPAAKLTKYLMDRGLAGVTRGTTDRIGRATLTYHLFRNRELVVLDSCPEIIRAIPQCVRDEDNLEDVLKVDTKADDCYDGFSLGLFGELGTRPKPQEEKDREKVAATTDAHQKFLVQYKLTQEREKRLAAAEDRRPEHWG
jgi:hypothetical protein